MILIADSGSSKTSWALADKGQIILEFASSGFNPYTQTKELISRIIEEEIFPRLKNFEIKWIYFYGAGCSTDENVTLIYNCFRDIFPKSNIEVEHDMLAAARAIWQDDEGMVAILGTGSNACVFDGTDIFDEGHSSLGFILGDEGSGAYMGKIMMHDLFYGKMPENLRDKIHEEHGLDEGTVLNHVYKMENPNRWLASFSVFVAENIGEDYCKRLVLKCIRDFFEVSIKQFPGYQKLPLGVVGSIGYYFRDQLEIVSKEYGVNLKKVIKSPMEELVNYHLQQEENQ